MIEEVAERLRAGYSILAIAAKMGGLLLLGSLLQILGELEERGRRGRSTVRADHR